MEDSSGFRPSAGNLEDPPNSRVFLVVSKYATEDLIRERFSDFGDIQDIWVVKDKQTKESKGIAFVKYAKSSQACRAMEEMHGRCLSESTKPIKVFIAQSRGSSNHRDVEDEELTRIFVMIPKSYTEEDVKQKFKEYGQIEYCSIIKNKNTGESKGLAYVRFLKPSQAALAIENCDRSFKAILAEPKNKGGGGSGGGGAENDYHNSARQETMIQHDHTAAATVFSYEYDYSSYDKNTDARTQETISKRLIVVSRLPMIQEQVHNLFDLIPGLEYCEVQRDPYNSFGHAIVQYQNISSAIYAKYKLHGFEYPPGNRLGVTYLNDGGDGSELLRKMASQMVAAQVSSLVWGSSQHYPSAPLMGRAYPYGAGMDASQDASLTPYERAYGSPVTSQLQTDAALPSIKKKAPSDAQSKERLFIVFNPHPLSLDIMEDAFCRFGNLIEVYIVPGKNVGYARYADVSSANEAIAVLHGKMVNGVKLKVMQADSPRDESNKRQRTY
ncbi:RNA binding motif protein 45 S homeolog isoform X1 [Xenopus laevis]|uniref:RNA binding motif protein 45 S homeolog isoform X1 n=1 Tax=Xenopus laevis TaxID=8355 RepID=A0A8J0TXE6_XENLA|nr:RNA binding motif protein 45 S homeolog isoform X1 [Xenopus laevis]